MNIKLTTFLLSIAFFSFNSCKKESGHAKPGEKVDLLLVDDEGVVIGSIPNKPIEEVNQPTAVERPKTIAPPIEPALVSPDNLPKIVTPTPDIPPRAIPVAPGNPDNNLLTDPLFPSLASHVILESQLTQQDYANGQKRFADVKARATTPIKNALLKKGLYLGDPVFIRVHKQEREVELFILHRNTNKYALAQTYKIAAMSGKLGPKLLEGDKQAPEGFYFVPMRNFNPASRFHLSFNIGYPNKYDKSYSRTGSAIMMHGNSVSIGCYAMTDPVIEEIYTICHAAISSGKQRYFRFHSFPFKMTEQNMAQHTNNQWFDFWTNLKEGYDFFETNGIPPSVEVRNQRYYFKQPQ